MDYMDWNDIDRASEAFRVGDGAPGTPFDEFRGKYLALPDWFDQSVDPLSEAYLSQQDRLWHMMAGDDAGYDPVRDEVTGPVDNWVNSVVRPGLYSAPTSIAGDHLIAMGHIVKHSNINSGDRVLEYGAGFGQIALTFARRGAEVHTVDIDEKFCSTVRTQAEFFKVPLNAHPGQFGENPAGGQYKLICFYESFHHARRFIKLIESLRELLVPEGRIIMAGEPIVSRDDPGFAKTCPYPWGIRLESEVAAIVRFRRWYELGFQEEFLLPLFVNRGFLCTKRPGVISPYANVYEFFLRPDVLHLNAMNMLPADDVTWHGREPDGRWSKEESSMTLDHSATWRQIRIDASNHHARKSIATFRIGSQASNCKFAAGERKTVILTRDSEAADLMVTAAAQSPIDYGSNDTRRLGVFVHSIEYLK